MDTKDGSLKSLFGKSLEQWNNFISWLEANKNSETLILASGSPICPINKNIIDHPELAQTSDGLLGYPEFLEQLVENVNEICPNAQLIWVAGDPHFSSCAQIKISSKGKSVNITSITASGLHSAIPFANADPYEYRWDDKQTIEYVEVVVV